MPAWGFGDFEFIRGLRVERLKSGAAQLAEGSDFVMGGSLLAMPVSRIAYGSFLQLQAEMLALVSELQWTGDLPAVDGILGPATRHLAREIVRHVLPWMGVSPPWWMVSLRTDDLAAQAIPFVEQYIKPARLKLGRYYMAKGTRRERRSISWGPGWPGTETDYWVPQDGSLGHDIVPETRVAKWVPLLAVTGLLAVVVGVAAIKIATTKAR